MNDRYLKWQLFEGQTLDENPRYFCVGYSARQRLEPDKDRAQLREIASNSLLKRRPDSILQFIDRQRTILFIADSSDTDHIGRKAPLASTFCPTLLGWLNPEGLADDLKANAEDFARIQKRALPPQWHYKVMEQILAQRYKLVAFLSTGLVFLASWWLFLRYLTVK